MLSRLRSRRKQRFEGGGPAGAPGRAERNGFESFRTSGCPRASPPIVRCALSQPGAMLLGREVPEHPNAAHDHGWTGRTFAAKINCRRLQTMNLLDRIAVDPAIRFGKPCVRGTRISVGDVLGYLAGGMSEAQILADFPQLTSDDIRACLAYAAERERRTFSTPAA